ncbi:hypothetical protein RN001_002948 [Aquatica leii]|uniref:Eukaryotic translation initiation factor 5B n=1 Tax=Aquatica leii TaxID=1421715 RepID=A0AAN7PHK5_9COLE|nr:hypothetical protein RN001_002948 [Aquatica leii]
MGKIKKGRKGTRDTESDSEGEVETQELIDKVNSKKSKSGNKNKIIDDEEIVVKKKGKAQNKKRNDSDTEEEIEIQEKNKKHKAGKDKKQVTVSDDETEVNEKGKSKNKKKDRKKVDDSDDDEMNVTKIQKSFALLQVESDQEDDVNVNSDSEEDSKPVVKKKESDVKAKDGGKKSKKARRKRDDSDDDIEQVLAELQMEYSGQLEKPGNESKLEDVTVDDVVDKKKVKKDKKTRKEIEKEIEDEIKSEDEEHTLKTAAQKKKEKKEREKQKKLAEKQAEKTKLEQQKQRELTETKSDVETKPEETVEVEKESKKKKKKVAKGDEKEEKENVVELESKPEGAAEEEEKEGKKKKKKGAKEEKDDKKEKKGPGKKAIAAMQEALKKMREEEEKLEKEEKERIKREEKAEQARLEALRLEKEKKEKKKQREKEKKERLRAEGKLFTAKQKADRARAQAMIDNLKAQGLELPDVGERKPRPGTRSKLSRLKPQKSVEKDKETEVQATEVKLEEQKVEVEIVEQPQTKESEDEVKDAWDAESSDDGESEEAALASETKLFENKKHIKKVESDDEDDESTDGEKESDSDEESESSDNDSEETDRRTEAEKRKEKAKLRIEQRRIDAEKNQNIENLRAAVVCVLGHVDTGKTKILDKLRRTNVQDGEAGGITQQIGATNVPLDAIKEQIKNVKGYSNMKFKLPGLLIIDTPGHESFSNLRSRGSSLCDFAILVVDIMHGLEPQTLESINLLKTKKTPFVVALNKIDRLYDWQSMGRKDISDIITNQAANTQLEFEQRKNEVVLQFAEQGLNAALCYENPDERSYVSLVPTSAVTGEGMGNLLSLIVENCQNRLTKRLMYSEELQATVLEVKAIPGLGTTIDAILINGTLREGETMVLAGTDGPITTQIRSLLMPQPMKELRVKNAYVEYKEIKAAQGVKIAAKELEKAIAGLNLYIAQKSDEVDILKEEVAKELKTALSGIKLQERGVYVQASTLGSLEALLEFLKASKIPYSGIRIGPVVKKDVMKASIMLEHESQYATILAFDVKIERDAQELADTLGVKIFHADIIYHLFDKFMAYREELKQKKREEFKHIAVFPCKLRILPQFIFNSRDPIVVGVMIEGGVVKEGTPICVPSKEFVDIGIVTSIEVNHKSVESARKGMEVCIKIEPIPGESPKMFGRHFDEKDFLISKISRQSIDACKDYFRDDLTKPDWQLMVELKKLFQIL